MPRPLKLRYRIQRLDLECDRAFQHVAEGRALVLRRVEEHRIDRRSRTTDAVEIKSHHCRELYRWRAVRPRGAEPKITSSDGWATLPAFQVSACGPSHDAAEAAVADRVGQLLADRGVVVICEGGSGVMATVAAGVRSRAADPAEGC